MKRVEWDYQVTALIELTRPEIEALRGVARDHYDFTVKSMAEPKDPRDPSIVAGIMYGWNVRLDDGDDGPVQVRVTSRQVDVICKAMEPLGMPGGDMLAKRHPEAVKLWLPFRQLMKDLNDEYRRLLAEEPTVPHDLKLDKDGRCYLEDDYLESHGVAEWRPLDKLHRRLLGLLKGSAKRSDD